MIVAIIVSLIAYYCANDLIIDKCQSKMDSCIDRKIWDYSDRSPLVYPSEEIIASFAKECREEIR